MKSRILIATTAAVLAAGTYYAVAQSSNPNMQGQSMGGAGSGTSGAMEQGSESRSGSTSRSAPGTSGMSTQSGQSDKSAQSPGAGKMDKNAQGSEKSQKSMGTSGQAQPSPSGSANSPAQRSQRNGAESDTQKNGTTQRSGASPSGSSSAAQQGSGSAGASANLTTEQRTKIRQSVLTKSNAPRVSSVNFSVSVGTVVPHTVHVVTVPPEIVEIHPAWRGYSYFIVNDEIVIVEPRTLKIVAVINV